MNDEEDSALDALPPPPAWKASGGAISRSALPSIPGFEILCELGRGGMGRVFKARQLKLQRVVAVKMLHVAEFADAEERDRFLHEAQALAALQHPNIVRIFEVGEDRDRPFLVMECLDGGALDKHLRGQPMEARAAAAVLETLARAVDHVHERGLLHRDLKLANVLLDSEATGAVQPDQVKLTDFGLAKHVTGDRTGESTKAIAGTPNYMSPEQAAGQPATRVSDVYSLGAILYELLTGRPPFVGANWLDVLTQVGGNEPQSPRRLVPNISRDLETICLKCLRKNPTQRYSSAGELADDIKRFRDGLPILALPIGPVQRIGKWARRRPAIAALLIILGISVLGGVSLVTWKWRQAIKAKDEAETNHRNELNALKLLAEEQIQSEVFRREAIANKSRAYADLINQADRAWQVGHMSRCRSLLNQCPVEMRNWEWSYLSERINAGQIVMPASKSKALQVAFRSDGRMMASSAGEVEDVKQDGVIKIWDPSTQKQLFELSGEHQGPVTWLAFHSNNRWLISLSVRIDMRRVIQGDAKAFDEVQGECVLWDLETRSKLVKIPGLLDTGALSADGTLFASGGVNGHMSIWRLDAKAPWQEVAKLPAYKGLLKKVAFSPDGKYLARCSIDIRGVERGELKYTPELKIWNCRDGTEDRTLPIGRVEIDALAFTPDGESLAWSNGVQRSVTLWDLKANRVLRTFYGHEATVQCLVFSKDGSQLATGGLDRLIKIWDVATGKDLRTLRGHDGSVECLAFNSGDIDRKLRLASSGSDGTIRIWDPAKGQEPLTLAGHPLAVTDVRYSPDGKSIASRSAGGILRIWDAADSRLRFEMVCGAERLAWHPNSRWLVTAGGDHRFPDKPGELIVWDAITGKELRRLDGHKRYVLAVAWSPDGKHLVSADGNPFAPSEQAGDLIVWNGETFAKELVWQPPIQCILDLAFIGGTAQVTAAGFDRDIHVLEPWNKRIVHSMKGHESPVNRIAFSRDFARLATGDVFGSVRIWDVATGKIEHVLRATANPIGGLCFNSRGDRLVTASIDVSFRDSSMIGIWDAQSGHEILKLSGKQSAHFSPDDRYLAIASPGSVVEPGSVRVLDAGAAKPSPKR